MPDQPTITPESRAKAQASKRSAKSVDGLISPLRGVHSPTALASIGRRLSEMPESCRKNYIKAMKGRSMAAGIKAFCLECMGWERAGVAECTAPACPLYPYRPFGGE